MYKNLLIKTTIFGIALLIGCGGGGGGSDEPIVDLDACELVSSSLKIINGEQCSGDNQPVLRMHIDSESASCSATLVSPNQAITAFHCVISSETDDLVSPSTLAFFKSDSGSVIARGRSISYPPGLVQDIVKIEQDIGDIDPSDPNAPKELIQSVMRNGFSDLAVITLDRNLSIRPTPILISTFPSQGSSIAILGYGSIQTTNFEAVDSLFGGETIVDDTGPKNISSFFNGDEGNTCKGDSGGPAFIKGADGRAELVGVTSISDGNCAPGETSVFTATAGNGIAEFLQTEIRGGELR